MSMRFKRFLATAALFSFLFSPTTGFVALNDVNSPPYETLDSVVYQLDKEGIDVARKLDSPAAIKYRSNRPVVGPLGTLDLPEKLSVNETAWIQEFKSGAIGAVVAVKENVGGSSASLDDLRGKWQRADKAKRVFISFTSEDLPYAHKVRGALEREGYVTFMFLLDKKEGPLLTPQEAGRFFKEAGHHFVIDTPNARKSTGIRLEKALLGTVVTRGAEGGPSLTSQPGPGKPGGPPTPPKATPPRGYGAGVSTPKSNPPAVSYKKCQICGARSFGYCHMRNINVCETHRYFTQGGARYRCP
jgi:hypothetical protein